MRWMNNDLDVSEKFLGFYGIPDINSSTIVTVMKYILICAEVLMTMKCYDGASNMLRKSSRVPRKFFAEQLKAHYTTAMLIRYRFRSKILLKALRFCETPSVRQRK